MITLQALLDSEVAEVINQGLIHQQCRRFPAIFQYSDTVSAVLERLGSRESVEEKLCGIVLRKSAPAVASDPDAAQQSAASPNSSGIRQMVFIKDVLGFIDLSIILQTALRRIFEGNVVHYDAEQLEGLANKFSTEAVGTLLDGGSSAYHGAMTTDWALKGAENSRLQELIRACFLLIKPGGSMRPPRSPAKSIHHVALYTFQGDDEASAQLTGVLSQTDIIGAFHEAKESRQGSTVFHKTVRELGLVGLCATDVPPSPSTTSSETSERHCLAAPGSRITLVPSSITTLEAFRRMCMHRDSGVGMLAPDGTLKNHLCATDLQCLAPGSFHKLLMPVDAFLEQRPLMGGRQAGVEAASDVEGEERPPKRARTVHCRGVLTCQATSTLAEVVSIMAAHDAHQVYVVDPDSKPLSSITIIDALRVILDSVSKVPGVHARSGTPATPQELLQEVAVRTSGLLESATSCHSDRGVSACTAASSDLSIPQVEIQTFSSAAKAEASKLQLRAAQQQPPQTAD